MSIPLTISSRLSSALDCVRLFAMIGVVFLHTASGFIFRADIVESKIYFPIAVFYSLSLTCISLFFMLSGFLTLHKPISVKANLHKTFYRLILPLLSFIFLGALLDYFGQQSPQNFFIVLFNYVLNLMSGNLWFLVVLSSFYLFRPLFSLVHDKTFFCYLFIVCFALGFILRLTHLHDPFLSQGTFSNILFCLGFYFFGGYQRFSEMKILAPPKIALLVFSSFVLIALNIFFDRYQMLATYFSAPRPYIFTFAHDFWLIISHSLPLLSFCLWPLFVSLLNISKILFPLLKKVATLSFGIYLFHTLVINSIFYFTRFGYDNLSLNIYQYVPLNFFLVLSCALLLSWLVSKVPYLKKIIGL
ncbi:acyltransferase family protein [Microgenomates group bacterium]|nr:acyltransferase family protein [Microgenomates group bacterium]